jgi:hypothetical protein
LDSTVSGQGPVAGCCECGDEPLGSCATELDIILKNILIIYWKSKEFMETIKNKKEIKK